MPSSAKRRIAQDADDSQSDTSVSGSQVARKRPRKAAEPAVEESDMDEDEDLEIESQTPSTARSFSTPKGMEISESGTISRVEVVNFMCHRHLKVDLGPKINFVIGHNGSGKSAILTAITIALGAKAHSTNRAKNLGSLIREGANGALVMVTITNKGSDAYRHDVYGDEIVIERKLLRDGGGQYKIKNSANRTISTKREELTAICDHMSIQIDNPLTVLTQDMARQFLNSSSGHDKYMLFMRGTQLLHLHEDYETIRESIDTTKAIIERKKTFLPELKKQSQEAKEKYEQMRSAANIEAEIEEAQNELVWRQIADKERATEEKRKEVKVLQDQYEQLVAKKAQAETKVKRQQEELDEAEKVAQEFQQKGVPHQEERRRVEQERVKLDRDLQAILGDGRDINVQVRQAKQRVDKYEADIERETAKRNTDNESKRVLLQSKLDESKDKLKQKSRQRDECQQKIQEVEGQQRHLDDDARQAKRDYQRLVDKIKNDNTKLENLKAQRSDRLAAFGRTMPQLLRDIESEKRWQRKPVGPLGRYIRVKKPEFSEVIETVLNRVLNAFVVESFRDQKLLQSMLRRHRLDWGTTIYVAKHDLFDFSNSEPDEQYMTILRALEFDDEWVKRQLVISADIQQTILVHERHQGDEIMRNGGPHNVKACYSKDCYKVGTNFGLRSEDRTKYTGPPRLSKDVGSAIERAQRELQSSSAQKAELQEIVDRNERKTRELKSDYIRLSREKRTLEEEITRISHECTRIQESMKEEEPVNIQFFMDKKEEMQEKIETLKRQYGELRNQEYEVQAKMKAVGEELERYNVADEQFQQELAEHQATVRSIQEGKANACKFADKIDQRMAVHKQRVDVGQKDLTYLENTLADWLNKAQLNFPNRVNPTETSEQLQRKIGNLQILKREKEKSTGISLEEAQEIAVQKLSEWTEAEQTVRIMEGLTKKMRKALLKRTERWLDMRKYIALSASGYFRYYMYKRGDDGLLKFHHDKQRLDIRVATGDQNKKGMRRKDSKSLSGGEKSFSQVSLLLALWQGIASPIVCLDEFDVYMDAVNRKQSMKMMMDSASENSSQYILITPQDASNMVPGPYITVHRLADPERRHE